MTAPTTPPARRQGPLKKLTEVGWGREEYMLSRPEALLSQMSVVVNVTMATRVEAVRDVIPGGVMLASPARTGPAVITLKPAWMRGTLQAINIACPVSV